MPPAARDYEFAPEEQPNSPGSPFSPRHSGARRIAYLLVAVVTGIGSTFPSALTTTNVPQLGGALGAYAAETSWLPAIYFAFNASANLTLVKGRAQFGIPGITHAVLAAWAVACVLQLFIPSLWTAGLARALNGIAAAALVTLTVYYLMQVLPAKIRPMAIVIGLGLPQLGTPLARMVPAEFMATNHALGAHALELSVACLLLGVTLAFPLPPSLRAKAFELVDGLTILIVTAALLALCGVLSLGRLEWWTDTPWLAWGLAGALLLFAAAALIETSRANPLVDLRWISTIDILRFAAVALLVRLGLAEQTYGAVGLLTSGGLTNDQLRPLFGVVALAMIGGIVAGAVTLSERRIGWQVMIACLCIALGAWLDSAGSNVTRPQQLYLSQALIGFGTTLFIGPALLFGLIRMLARGPAFLVSIVVLFGFTQSVGALLGSAILGTYQTIRTRAHAAFLTDHLSAADPQVAARLAGTARSLAPVIADPVQRNAQSAALLGRSMSQEASLLAFNDVFQLVSVIALLSAAYVAFLIVVYELRRRRRLAEDQV